MNFASSHVYLYDESDEEYLSDDEYQAKLNLSDSSDDEEECDAHEDEGTVGMAAAGFSGTPGGRGGSARKPLSIFGGLFGAKGSSDSAPPPPPAAELSKKSKKRKVKIRSWKSEAKSGPVEKNLADCCPPPEETADKKKAKQSWRRADTNVVSVQLEELVSPSNMHTGDFVRCHNCKGVMSHITKLKDSGDDKVWECDFCGSINVVDVVDEEIPKMEDVTYMLAPAPTTTASGKSGKDESLVVFCMDTSGSMCVTTEVAGRIALRGDTTKKLQSLNDTGETQWMPGQRRNVTYVSRLQSTQAAVDHQLETMAQEHPDRKVALVTFNTSVTFIGDGLQEEKILSGDKLGDREQITACAKELTLPDAVKKSRATLGKKLFDLEEKGQTALGPALLLSVVMACRQSASKVIICTDGLANVGLGSLDTKSDEAAEAAHNFYTDVANLALEQGVSISVIAIDGTDCKLVELGRVADITGGQVNIVKPENLTKEFGTILADPIIATNVMAVFTVHNQLYIRDAEDSSQSNWTERTVGNVTADTEITFEFGVRHTSKRKAAKNKEGKQKGDEQKKDEPDGAGKPDSSDNMDTAESEVKDDAAGGSSSKGSDKPKELPFQIQITYTDLEGAKAMRVVTQRKPVTKERKEAERNLNFDVLGTNACQTSARLAQQGKFKEARLNAMMNHRLFYRQKHSAPEKRTGKISSAYKGYMTTVTPLYEAASTEERATYGKPSSDPVIWQSRVSDRSANIFYQAKKNGSRSSSRKDPAE